MFECHKISFAYDENKILNDVSFYVEKGEIVTILGASGCGKTTLFRLMTGLERLQHGKMSIAGGPISEGHHKITYMMQEDLLLPWRSVWENMTLIADWIKPRPDMAQFNKKARTLLEEVGLGKHEDKYPREMSGGMRQRVSLARALLQERPLLLLDEPFGALDVLTREQMYQLLLDIREKRNLSILLVTHDFKDALVLSDRIYLLAKDEGIYDEIKVPKNLHDDPKKWIEMQDSLRDIMIQMQQPQLLKL